MATWAWLAAYVIAFGLLQLVLYRYFQRDTAPGATAAAAEASRGGGSDHPSHDSDDAVRCRYCGSYNEPHPTFAFCRNCVASLQ